MVIAIFSLVLFFHIIFCIAIKLKDNSIADIVWGIGFVLIDLVLLCQSSDIHFPQLIVSVLILIWGLRLSGYLYLRKRGKPEDFRYQALRQMWGSHHVIGSYLQVFLLQMILLLLIATPLFIAYQTAHYSSLFTILGLLIAIIGFAVEVISDHQLVQFKKNKLNQGKMIQSGLWHYSRHPNYFGESLFWWGIACIVYPLSTHFLWFLSPAIITILVRYVSGVPLLEKKYQDNIEFQIYAKKTACFVPWFPKKG